MITKVALQKFLFDILHVSTLNFSDITFIVISSTFKMVSGITYILSSIYLASQNVNQTFIVAIKTMVYFINILSGEARELISNIYALTNLISRIILVFKNIYSELRITISSLWEMSHSP